jgi:3-mercaptopyruvate sulfurtransferase SseA
MEGPCAHTRDTKVLARYAATLQQAVAKLERRHGVQRSTVAVLFMDVSHCFKKYFWFFVGTFSTPSVKVASPLSAGTKAWTIFYLYNEQSKARARFSEIVAVKVANQLAEKVEGEETSHSISKSVREGR